MSPCPSRFEDDKHVTELQLFVPDKQSNSQTSMGISTQAMVGSDNS